MVTVTMETFSYVLATGTSPIIFAACAGPLVAKAAPSRVRIAVPATIGVDVAMGQIVVFIFEGSYRSCFHLKRGNKRSSADIGGNFVKLCGHVHQLLSFSPVWATLSLVSSIT
jgi:hypothetical protein